MKSAYLLFCFLLLTIKAQAQVMQPINLSKQERNHLNLCWKIFKGALLTKNKTIIYRQSLSNVDCVMLKKDNEKSSFMPISTFTNRFYKKLFGTKIWSVLKDKKYRFSAENAIKYHTHEFKYQRSKSLLIYEIWYTTWERDEYAKGDEGISHAFEFIKIGNRLKFYGITSIP